MGRWFRKKPEEDTRLVGLSFVEVLFALVIARVLEPFANPGQIPAAGISHLLLAGLLTVTSWIGYHNSWNRPRYFIRFPNLPLLQFTIDIILVVVYWLIAVSAEAAVKDINALPETLLVTLSFLLYAGWDHVALAMRKDPDYKALPQGKDVPARRRVTYWSSLLAVLTLAFVVLCRPESTSAVIAIDIWLILLLLLFRFWKELVTPEGREKRSVPG